MKTEMKGEGATVDFLLEPFKSIHLHSQYDGFEPNNSITYVYILEAVTLMILAIACFTYINLNTARSIERAREVGVRKVIGADNKQLFWQFIGESVLICSLAAILSIVAAILLLPAFNNLAEKQLQISSLLSPQFAGFAVSLVLVISLLAGCYPALILANFQPVKVLKGSFKNTGSGQWVRKSLTVFQFAISVVLIISTFVIQKQLNYIQSRKLGYDRDHIVVLPFNSQLRPKLQLIKDQLKANTSILNVSRCSSPPVNIIGGYNMRSDIMPENQQIAVTADLIDEDFIPTTGLQLVAGENLTRQDMKDVGHDDSKGETNTYHFILNESAAKQLGWSPQEAIGKKMYMSSSRPGYVRGVVKDFVFESMHNTIKPVVLFPEQWSRFLLVKVKGNNLPQTISFIESKWKELVPSKPFEYHFMDDDFNRLYSSEIRLGKVLNIFAGIAIALACLGLLGLSAYSAKQRIKEIGIRKVLGASVANIATILSTDFVKLVIIAILISTPIAWWAMYKWIQGFVYRTDISWITFVFAGLAAVAIAVITVSFQAIKAALSNPVKSLRE